MQVYGCDLRTPQSTAHLASLAAGLGQGSRVLEHYDPYYGWTRSELLQAALVDIVRGMGLKKGQTLKDPVTPKPKGAKDPSAEGTRKMGVAVDVNFINEQFGLLDRLKGGADG